MLLELTNFSKRFQDVSISIPSNFPTAGFGEAAFGKGPAVSERMFCRGFTLLSFHGLENNYMYIYIYTYVYISFYIFMDFCSPLIFHQTKPTNHQKKHCLMEPYDIMFTFIHKHCFFFPICWLCLEVHSVGQDELRWTLRR